MSRSVTPRPTRFRVVALPAEHGSWGLLVEPFVLGFWIAPSVAGAWLGLAALGGFLAHHPLKLVFKDWRMGRRTPRTSLARWFVCLYGLVALLGSAVTLWVAQSLFWVPLLLAAPLAVLQFYYDTLGRGRGIVPQLAGAIALSSMASAVALAGDWLLVNALMLWLILIARSVTTILYVRTRLRRNRGEVSSTTPVWLAHLIGLFVLLGLAYKAMLPWLAVLALGVLFVRAIVGLLFSNQSVSTKTVGKQEIGFGILTVVLVGIGYTLGL